MVLEGVWTFRRSHTSLRLVLLKILPPPAHGGAPTKWAVVL